MTSNYCGKMSLLLPVVAMLVLTVFPSQGNTELADIDPFDEIPEKLVVKGWAELDPEDPHDDVHMLAALALIGLNKIRAANNLTANLSTEKELTFWSGLVSAHLGKLLVLQGDNFTLPTQGDVSVEFFDKIFDYKKEEQTVVRSKRVKTSDDPDDPDEPEELNLTPVSTLSLTDFLVATIRNWYTKIQADVKNGATKESISFLRPDIEKIGVGFSKKMGEVINDNVTTYYTCVINFGTVSQYASMLKIANETYTPSPEDDTTTPDDTTAIITTPVSESHPNTNTPDDTTTPVSSATPATP